jgi:DNA-directed RNA polymerase specialized sigma24 family protein
MAVSQLLFLSHRALARRLEREVRPAEKHWVSADDVVHDTILLAFRGIQTCRARDHETFFDRLKRLIASFKTTDDKAG